MLLGVIVRWLLGGCKTSLRDDIRKHYNEVGENDIYNYVIGITTGAIIIGIILILMWLCPQWFR